MTVTRIPGRHRAAVLTALSLPRYCDVCRNDRVVLLAALVGFRGAGQMACPHCSSGTPIPLLTLPMRTDTPSGTAA